MSVAEHQQHHTEDMNFARQKKSKRSWNSDESPMVIANAGTALISTAVVITMLAQLRGEYTKDKTRKQEKDMTDAEKQDFVRLLSQTKQQSESVPKETSSQVEKLLLENQKLQETVAIWEAKQLEQRNNHSLAFKRVLTDTNGTMAEVKQENEKLQEKIQEKIEKVNMGEMRDDEEQNANGLIWSQFERQVERLDNVQKKIESLVAFLSEISMDVKQQENKDLTRVECTPFGKMDFHQMIIL